MMIVVKLFLDLIHFSTEYQSMNEVIQEYIVHLHSINIDCIMTILISVLLS